MTLQSEDTNDAVRQLARGATLGMVDTALQKKGIGSGPRSEILEIAKRIVNRRARLKHLLIGAVGLAILAGGGYAYYLCVINGFHLVRIPVIVMVTGLLLTTYGIYNSTQNEI